MRRLATSLSLILLLAAFVWPSTARAQQAISINAGVFVPRGEDARVEGDVLFNDLGFFAFDLSKMKSGTFGAEWLAALNDRTEVGLGVGYYSDEVPSIYSDLVDASGYNIGQRLKLRIAPITATFRVIPFGRRTPVQPYVGAGVGIMSWRYTETGDFVDYDSFIFHDRFEGSGWAVGPVILGGVRIPIGQVDVGMEIRHQSGSGELDPVDFAGGRKIDLGGFNYLATFNIRF